MIEITLRKALGMLAVTAVPSAGAIAYAATKSPPEEPEVPQLTPADRVRHCAEQLSQAMADVRPGSIFRVDVDHKYEFVLVIARASRVETPFFAACEGKVSL